MTHIQLYKYVIEDESHTLAMNRPYACIIAVLSIPLQRCSSLTANQGLINVSYIKDERNFIPRLLYKDIYLLNITIGSLVQQFILALNNVIGLFSVIL